MNRKFTAGIIGGFVVGVATAIIGIAHTKTAPVPLGKPAVLNPGVKSGVGGPEIPFIEATPLPVPAPPIVSRDPVVQLDGKNRVHSERLSKVAFETAGDMLARQAHLYQNIQGFHNPRLPTGARENICWAMGDADTWNNVYRIWHGSQGHQANWEAGGKYMGYAKVTNGNVSYYAVIYSENP